jgi:hypothetical protein
MTLIVISNDDADNKDQRGKHTPKTKRIKVFSTRGVKSSSSSPHANKSKNKNGIQFQNVITVTHLL